MPVSESRRTNIQTGPPNSGVGFATGKTSYPVILNGAPPSESGCKLSDMVQLSTRLCVPTSTAAPWASAWSPWCSRPTGWCQGVAQHKARSRAGRARLRALCWATPWHHPVGRLHHGLHAEAHGAAVDVGTHSRVLN